MKGTIMSTPSKDTQPCPECGAPNTPDRSCEDIFHELLGFESLHPEIYDNAHHLSVACYNAQHPNRFTDEFWRSTIDLIREIIAEQLLGPALRERVRARLAAAPKQVSFRGTPTINHEHHWTMHITDIVMTDGDAYVTSIWEWARSIIETGQAEAN
jgi:Family of unknown function (DUF5946)